MADIEATLPGDLPPPSGLAILFRVAMTRWLASVPKEEAVAILHEMAEELATEHSLAHVLLLRPPPEQDAVNRARREAIAMFRRFVPVWLSALDSTPPPIITRGPSCEAPRSPGPRDRLSAEP